MSTSPSRRVIAVAGNIGSGKSSLVSFLCTRYGVEPFFEPNEQNPYLKDFYSDMQRWAFHSQVFFLTHRFRIHQNAAQGSGTAVLDRTIYEDAEIFARNLFLQRKMVGRDYETYEALYRSLIGALRPPDLLLYLRCNVRTIRQRIRMRGRPEEQAIPLRYIQRLNRQYEDWFSAYELGPTAVVETDRLDYLTDLEGRLDLLHTIERHL